MKTKRIFSQILSAVVIFFIPALTSKAQTDLGSSCGCPAIASRGNPVNMSSLPGFDQVSGELKQGAILTCDRTYLIDELIFIPAGQILKIAPGTLSRGKKGGRPDEEVALIIERGAKLDANGTEFCPIVFTGDSDPMDGTYSLDNKCQWGGIIIMGRALNNLLKINNSDTEFGDNGNSVAVQDGLGRFRSLQDIPTDGRYFFGANLSAGETFNNSDNSGTLRYVSIRFSGAITPISLELDALTLCSVGNGTTIDHVEIVSPGNDGIRFFGGNVNIKYISVLYGNDDMFDWTLGYQGKSQFLFGIKGPSSVISQDSDNGFEGDAANNKSGNPPASHPIIYNATFIGNTKYNLNNNGLGDNSALAAINAKAGTEGEIYNSVFAEFRRGLNITKSTMKTDAYAKWVSSGPQTLKIKCNTFFQPVTVTEDFTIDQVLAAGTDRTQFTTTDKNVTVNVATPGSYPLNGFNPIYTLTLPAIIHPVPDVVPTLLSTAGCQLASPDGFLIPAAYRGAFAPTGKNWLANWTYTSVIRSVVGTAPCATDITSDGITNVSDLGAVLVEYGKKCK